MANLFFFFFLWPIGDRINGVPLYIDIYCLRLHIRQMCKRVLLVT